MVITLFFLYDKNIKFFFFQKTFILADICIDMVFRIPFAFWIMLRFISTIENSDKGHIPWERLFPLPEKWSWLKKKKPAAVVLDPKYEIFLIYISFFVFSDEIYLFTWPGCPYWKSMRPSQLFSRNIPNLQMFSPQSWLWSFQSSRWSIIRSSILLTVNCHPIYWFIANN